MNPLTEIHNHLTHFPPVLQSEVLDFVLFLQKRHQLDRSIDEDAERKKVILESFQQLSESGAFSEIVDPVEWQRAQRRDRPLPGRDE